MPADKLGAWTGDDLKSTVESYAGAAYYANVEDSIRFTHGVAKMIRKRLAKAGVGSEKGAPSVFVLGMPPDGITDQVKTIPRLDSGMYQLSGLFGTKTMMGLDFRCVNCFGVQYKKISDYLILGQWGIMDLRSIPPRSPSASTNGCSRTTPSRGTGYSTLMAAHAV
jgi:hypothetical protein